MEAVEGVDVLIEVAHPISNEANALKHLLNAMAPIARFALPMIDITFALRVAGFRGIAIGCNFCLRERILLPTKSLARSNTALHPHRVRPQEASCIDERL